MESDGTSPRQTSSSTWSVYHSGTSNQVRGTKGCAACFGDAKVQSPECRARFQNIVDNEAAQKAAANASEPNAEMREQTVGGSAPSSSSGPAPAAGRPAPEDANMEPAESSAQPTSSVVRTMEAEDGMSAKRQKLMAGMPILHETDVDVNMDAHKLVVLAAMPDDQGKWTQRVIDSDKKYYGGKSGTLLDTQKVYHLGENNYSFDALQAYCFGINIKL